jgi:hypothetical protein
MESYDSDNKKACVNFLYGCVFGILITCGVFALTVICFLWAKLIKVFYLWM